MSNLYNMIKANLAEIKADTTITAEVLSKPAVNQLYQQIVPIKPNILAEERIFVYVPKVMYDSAGIAKFATDQFNIVDGRVSLKGDYLNNLPEIQQIINDISLLMTLSEMGIPISEEQPDENTTLWFKIIK